MSLVTSSATTALATERAPGRDRDVSPLLSNHHYDLPFIGPEKRHWNVWLFLKKLYWVWERKIPPPTMFSIVPKGI